MLAVCSLGLGVLGNQEVGVAAEDMLVGSPGLGVLGNRDVGVGVDMGGGLS